MGFAKQLRNLFRIRRYRRDVADELAFHIDMRTEDNIRRGMTAAEARREAERAFGNRTLLSERTRDFDIPRWLDRLSQDLRYSFRSLRSSRAATAVLVTSLALGIGANTAMFTLLYGLLMRPLPVRDPGSLYSVTLGNFCSYGWTEREGVLNHALWEDLRRTQTVFSELFAYSPVTLDISRVGEVHLIAGAYASSAMWDVLGVRPVLGRTIVPADEKLGSTSAVAVIGEAFWESEFGRDPGVIGRTIAIGGRPVTVIGVAPRSFLGMYVGQRVDVFLPVEASAWLEAPDNPLANGQRWWLNAVGRLRPGVTPGQAGRQLAALSPAAMQRTIPANWPKDQTAIYLRQRFETERAGTGLSDVRESLKRPLLVASTLLALLLLLACANIATLQLSRGIGRQREFAVRVALGASRARLGFQVLLEGLIAASIGAVLGIVVAGPAARVLTALYSTDLRSFQIETRPDSPVVLFSTGLAVTTAVLFGLAAALQAMRTNAHDVLKAVRATAGVQPLRQWLLGVQVCLAVILAAGAMLFGATLRSLMTQDSGYNAANVLLLELETQRAGIQDSERGQFYRNLLDRLVAVPGVESVGASFVTPLGGGAWQGGIQVEDENGAKSAHTYIQGVSEEYFRTYGTRVIEGRSVSRQDTAGAPQVALVNRTFVRTVLGGGSFAGKRIRGKGPGDEWNAEIVGVVADAKYRNLRSPVPPTVYFVMAQTPTPPAGISVGLRTAGPIADSIPGVRRAMAEINPKVAYMFRSFETQVANSLVQERAIAAVSSLFGVLALLLSGVGIYGLAAYSVMQRRTEISIRIALGATADRILKLLFSQTGRAVFAGVLAGAICTVGGARFVRTLLFQVTPGSAWVYIVTATLLLAVAAVAIIGPSVRAIRLDPAQTLRSE